MRKTISILFALALVLSFSLVAATPVAAANTYYVATTGSDSNGGTSWADAWLTIQHAVGIVASGDTIMVGAGTYPESGEVVITQDLTIIGVDKTTTIIQPAGGFVGSYLFRINGGTFTLTNVTIDGTSNLYGGVRFTSPGTGIISGNIIKDVMSSKYIGFGIVVYGNGVTISGNIFSGIERVGVWVGGSNVLVAGNTYIGKGTGDWLDYGVEVGSGGTAVITGNTITNCGSSLSGWGSGAILVTTLYGAGTAADITCNTLTGNEYGIVVGYDGSDTSVVAAHFNSIAGNSHGVDTTAPGVDAENNWWGDDSGPSGVGPGSGDAVSANVDYDPWIKKSVATMTGTGTASFATSAGNVVGLTPVAPPSLPSVTFPHGMFSFQICCLTPGDTVTLTVTLPSNVPVGTVWWKYHNGQWSSLPNLSDNGDNVMIIQLTDGGAGDFDSIPGQITDPGGPGNPMTVGWEGSPTSKATILWPWIAIVAAVAAALGLLVLRRRQALR